MPTTLRPSTDALVAKYGSIARIPEAILAECGYTRFRREVSGDTTIVDREWPARARKLAFWVQRKYDGYLFTDDLRRLINTVAGTDLVSNRDLVLMQKRAKAFIEAEIPPIFERRFCLNFPLIDFLIQYGSGSHERRIRARAAQGVSTKLNPASAEDVRIFRSIAFLDNGTIEEPLIREILHYCAKTYGFKNEDTRNFVLSQTEAAMRFLGNTLRDLSHEPRRYVDILPGTEELAINGRRWYLHVRPEKREELVRAFLAKLTREETQQRLHILRMRIEPMFPEWCTEQTVQMRAERRAEEEAKENSARVRRAIETLDFREVPAPCFEREPWASLLRPALNRYTNEVIEMLDDEGLKQLCNTSRSAMRPHVLVNLPKSFVLPIELWVMMQRERTRRVRAMDDEEFLRIFPRNMKGLRDGALSGAVSRNDTDEVAYWHEVRERLKCLRPDD